MADPVPATVKWGKARFKLTITPGASADGFKSELNKLTKVPVERMKVMCKQGWKGALEAGQSFDPALSSGKKAELTVTMLGTADAVITAAAGEPTVFVEDLPADDDTALDPEAVAAAEGMVVPLQVRPGPARDDGKAIRYQYNYFVTGMPQRLIESKLARRRDEGGGKLLGECAMQLGKELGKAMVSVVASLTDGTLVSGLDNGRMQLWRHGVRLKEVMHNPPGGGFQAMMGTAGPVACIAVLPGGAQHKDKALAFATGGSGCVRFWTSDGECIEELSAPMGMTPRTMVATGPTQLAVTFGQRVAFDPNAFRLVPQNEEQRHRRDAAMAQQQAQADVFGRLATRVNLVELRPITPWAGTGMVLEPLPGRAAAVMAVAVMDRPTLNELVVADAGGGIALWSRSDQAGAWGRTGQLQLSGDDGVGVSIIDVETLAEQPGVLAASVAPFGAAAPSGDEMGTAVLRVPPSACGAAGGVVLVNVASQTLLAVLVGHADIVRCLCATPDGDIITGGGKKDAKVRVWHRSQWDPSSAPSDAGATASPAEPPSAAIVLTDAAQTLKEPGYSLALTVLPDAKLGSKHYALASGRYNLVQICL